MSFMKKPQHRIFEYTPQHYDPEKDEKYQEKERRKKRLGFRTARARHKVKTKSAIYYIILFAVVIYLYLLLSGNI